MAKERRKIIQAGKLWMAVQYTAIRSGDTTARREARAQISSPARESLNAKLSWQKLMMLRRLRCWIRSYLFWNLTAVWGQRVFRNSGCAIFRSFANDVLII